MADHATTSRAYSTDERAHRSIVVMGQQLEAMANTLQHDPEAMNAYEQQLHDIALALLSLRFHLQTRKKARAA